MGAFCYVNTFHGHAVLPMSLLPQDPKERKYMMMGLRIVGDFGISIAAPVVVFVWIGQWLEETYGYAPWFTIGAFILAALLSARLIYKKAKVYGEEYKALDKKNDLENE